MHQNQEPENNYREWACTCLAYGWRVSSFERGSHGIRKLKKKNKNKNKKKH